MRRRPRSSVPGVSIPSTATLGRAISSRRNRTRDHIHTVSHSQIHPRTRNHSSRLLAVQNQQRPAASSSASSSSPASARFYSALSSLIESAAKESRDTAIMASQSFSVPWDRVKLWVEEQEKAEQQGKSLAKPQLAALSHLVDFLEPEPVITGQDYVSVLMQHIQHGKHPPHTPPTYQDVGFEVPVKGNFHWRWRTTCSLPSVSHKVFPCEGYGIPQGGQPPLFATKKASKQYAAKYALAYRQAHNSSSSNLTSGGASLKSAVSPKPADPPKLTDPHVFKSPKSSDSSLIVDSSVATTSGDTGGASLTPPSPIVEQTAKNEPVAELQSGLITPDDGETKNGETSSIQSRLVDVANRIKFGTPSYKYELYDVGQYAGSVVFQNGFLPPDVGHVKGAISKNAAKEQVAEQALKYLEVELMKRQGFTSDLLKERPTS
ncbi:hypothetical protein V8C42DRAFT_319938 [Trichoderma barbatum]